MGSMGSNAEFEVAGSLHFGDRVAGNIGSMLGMDDGSLWDSEEGTEETEMTAVEHDT